LLIRVSACFDDVAQYLVAALRMQGAGD